MRQVTDYTFTDEESENVKNDTRKKKKKTGQERMLLYTSAMNASLIRIGELESSPGVAAVHGRDEKSFFFHLRFWNRVLYGKRARASEFHRLMCTTLLHYYYYYY